MSAADSGSDNVCSCIRVGHAYGGRVCSLDEPWFYFMRGGGMVCVSDSHGVGIFGERVSQIECFPKVSSSIVLLVVVAGEAHDTEGQDDDEQEKESKDNADYCDDQWYRVCTCCACICMNVSML